MNLKQCIFYLFTLFLYLNLFADVPRTMYVLNGAAETVSKMNMETKAVHQNVAKTGQIPNDILSHDQKVFVLNSGSSSIQIIDPKTDTVIRTINLTEGANPWAMEFVGSNKAYVTNYAAHTVSVVDIKEGKIIKEIPVGKSPEGILVVKNTAFITNTGFTGPGMPYESPSVSIIDILADSVTHTLDVPVNPQVAALASDGKIHVLCTGNYNDETGKIAVIDLYTGPGYNIPAVVDTLDIGGFPGDLAITAYGKGYCMAWGDGSHGFLYSYDALGNSVMRDGENPIHVGPNAGQMIYDSRQDCLWLTTMTQWGGDGFVQRYDIQADSVVWTSDVLGSGTQKLAILEPIYEITPWADAVASFAPGEGAGFGANYFPNNVLGPPDPDPTINEYKGSNKPQEVLSLGHGGEIVLEFTDNFIVDKNGPDFTVFENVFLSSWTDEAFIEAGIVSVSQDGADFVTFPYDTATWKGLAGVTPTRDSQQPMDPAKSGGDQFDLADVGLEWVQFVKISDLGDIKKEGQWNGDFDLDAVVAIHSQTEKPSIVQKSGDQLPDSFVLKQNYPNPLNPETTIEFETFQRAHVSVTIYSVDGTLVTNLLETEVNPGIHHIQWNGASSTGVQVSSGIYMAQVKAGRSSRHIKMTLVR